MNFHISKILNQRIFGKSLEAYEIYSEQRSSTFVEKAKGTLADEDRIINPSPKPIAADPDELNVHFTNTTQRILGTNPSSSECLKNYTTFLSDYGNDFFSLRPVSFKEVERQIKSIGTDCATGPDLIPAKYTNAHHRRMYHSERLSHCVQKIQNIFCS